VILEICDNVHTNEIPFHTGVRNRRTKEDDTR
jgi:hypothetical protein